MIRQFAFVLPDLGKAPDVEVWPRPALSPERFMEIAHSKKAAFGVQCYELPSGHPVWRAEWGEGGCRMVLHGPAFSRERFEELNSVAV